MALANVAYNRRFGWERFLLAERFGDTAGEILAKRRVAAFNDGEFDARLRGDGTLAVRTRAYACRCLEAGRKVKPEERAPGLFLLKLPLPTRLNHINCYLFDEGDSWSVLDTGMLHEAARAIWTQTFAGLMGSRPVRRQREMICLHRRRAS